MRTNLSRRDALRGLSLGTAGGVLTSRGLASAETTPSPAAAAQPPGVCVLFPQAVEGPFYFDQKLTRADITGGRPGAPVKLGLRIIESGACTPITKARVDVWHADASGVYSGYAGQGDTRDVSTKGATYLRGTQTTDADGRVTFNTVYPGWYPGRTPHIHVKVILDAKSLVTGQVYFPDDVNKRIYAEREPYKARQHPDTTNTSDGIFNDGQRDGGGTVLSVVADATDAQVLVASLLISVDKSGGAAREADGWFGWIRALAGR